MSKGGGSTTTKVKLPKWVDEAAQSNYQMATDVASRPYTPYTGERIAGFNDVQTRGMDAALGFAGGNVGMGAINDARGIAQGVSSYNPAEIAAGIDKYMNPYLDKVAGNVMDNLDRSRQMALMSGGAAATSAGAYGGSRHGIADALTNSEFFRNAGQQMDNIYAQGFNTAAGLSAQDIANATAAQQLKLGAAGQIANLGQMERAFGLQDIGLMNQVGLQQQQMQQMQNDLAYQNFVEQRDYPLQQLAIRQQALGMSPYGSAQVQQGGGSNPFGGILGGGLAGAGIGAMMAAPGATGLAALGGWMPMAIGAGLGLLGSY